MTAVPRKSSKSGELAALRRELRREADTEKAAHLQRFFKTGPGEYGEGDRFLGIRVPVTRKTARKYASLQEDLVEELLRSPWHEERLLALVILVDHFKKGDEKRKRDIYRLYLDSTKWINSWDLVDITAEHIVGAWLWEKKRTPLYRLARSKSLWERRIGVMATFYFIRRGDFDDTIQIAEMLLDDGEDLIHKAVGWMLREVGNRDRAREEVFLKKHCRDMPRTMLRYAIEKFPEGLRKRYLSGKV